VLIALSMVADSRLGKGAWALDRGFVEMTETMGVEETTTVPVANAAARATDEGCDNGAEMDNARLRDDDRHRRMQLRLVSPPHDVRSHLMPPHY
jgi:hypothetical protein